MYFRLQITVIQSLQTYLNSYKYLGLFKSNSNQFGFENILLLSNSFKQNNANHNNLQLCFLNYDFKNHIETFPDKKNNPLNFPDQLYIDVEKCILLNDLIIENSQLEKHPINFKATISKEDYLEKVNALKKHIQQGDIYEINFCMTFEAHSVKIDPLTIYKKLNDISHASYSALAKFDHQYIISSSPELFIKKQGDTLITKPIKGTSKRGSSIEEDDILKQKLHQNIKERNENVMIVDVARNDLSRIAQKGSVKVNQLYHIETYQQVHQMVSTISCQIKKSTSFNDIIQATFPMASMTGAPKIRAMQLIDEYELYNRGPYSGALGYIKDNGDFDLNVLIRSIFYDEKKQYLSFTVGSAITAMCHAEDEYEECLLKAKAMMTALS